MPLQLFPLTGGMQQGYDARLLPDGVLANAVNCEIERIGRLVGRAKYTAIASTTYGSGTFTGYDLFSVDDRLFALGDRRSQSYPTDIFEYVPAGAAAWSPSDRSPATHRLPRATRLREIARPPDVSGGVSNFSVAAVSGFVLLAYNNDDPDGVDNGYLHIVIAARDQTVLFDELDTLSNNVCLKLKALALSDRFIIIGTNLAADRIGARRFIPASDESSASVSTSLFSGLGAVNAFEAIKVEGSDQFVIVANIAGTIITRRFDSAGVLQVPSGGAYANISANPTHLALYAHASDNHIVIAYEVSGTLRIQSYNLSTGATIDSAVAQLASVTVTEVSILRGGSSSALIVASGADSNAEDSVYLGSFNVGSAAATATSTRMVVDATLTSHAILQGGELVFGMRYGSTATGPALATNVLMSGIVDVSGLTAGRMQMLAVKDLEAAGPPGVHLPEIVLDSSGTTPRYYWANCSINPDSDASALVTEFALGLAERRQVALFGNHAYISGGLPLVYDLRCLSEIAFAERPRIISLTAGSSGSLLSSATYKYRLHAEMVDAQGDLHLSPPSTISEVTLGGSDTKVTAVCATGHSLRRNQPAGFVGLSVRHVLSRTLASVSRTQPFVVGGASINPPSASLSGLTLILNGSGTNYTVTFSAGATTQTQILSEINTVTSAEITATAESGLLVLTAVDSGDGAVVEVRDTGTANSILGFTGGAISNGETTITVGENFQRAASAYNPTADVPGEFVSIADTRKDESDPIIDSDLIRQQVLYSQGLASGAHHAPPPSDCIWAGKERLGFFRQPVRSRWTASKLIVPFEPAECAAQGFLQFSGTVGGEIEAGAFVGGAMCLWTRKQIWLVTGDGPKRNGVGEFNQADCITRSVGLISDGWQSMCQDDEGVWFQGSDGEIYRLGNGGNIEWLGKPVREYLATYPKVVAAVYRQSKREVAFAVTNAAGTTGGILRRNALVPDSPAWFFDDVGAVSSLADYQGRLAYVQSGTVYIQDASPGSGAFPTFYFDSGMFQGFQALGYGALEEVGVLATFRGRCTVTLKIGTDGSTFPDTIASWALTSSEYAVGTRVPLLIDPPQHQYDSFQLRAEVSDVTGTTEGIWLHAFAVKTELQPDFVRLPPSRRL